MEKKSFAIQLFNLYSVHYLYDFFCCAYLSEEAAFQVIVPVIPMNQDFKTTHFTLYYDKNIYQDIFIFIVKSLHVLRS